MPGSTSRSLVLLFAIGVLAASADDADAQFFQQYPQQYQAPARPRPKVHRPSPRRPRETHEKPIPAAPPDKRDSIIAAPGSPYNGHAYWVALAQCGGIYFKLNTLYTDVAVRARVIKPDPKANAEYTKDLNEAIRTATAYFDGAERFLMTDRGIERADAVLTYNGRSREAGERLKTIDAALTAGKSCYALYQSCHEAFPKACVESNLPIK